MTPELHRLAGAFQAELANTDAALNRLERLIRAATRICPECKGCGRIYVGTGEVVTTIPCPDCDGTGEVELPLIPREDEEVMECPGCLGTGIDKQTGEECEECWGTGGVTL